MNELLNHPQAANAVEPRMPVQQTQVDEPPKPQAEEEAENEDFDISIYLDLSKLEESD